MTSDSGADRFDFNGFDEVLPMVGTTNHLITDSRPSTPGAFDVLVMNGPIALTAADFVL